MSQSVILNNFILYLKFSSSVYIAELEKQKATSIDTRAIARLDKIDKEHKAHIEQLKIILDHGYCFGLSLCHAAMDYSGKLNWWENALVALNNWDGSEDELDREFNLPDSINGKPMTRRKIFELGMNYILPSYAGADFFQDFKFEGINQDTILQPDAQVIDAYKEQPERRQSYFEMLGNNGEILTIKSRKRIGGSFTEENLESLLSEKTIQDKICLIHNGDHTIRIGYDGERWTLYDPNYRHDNLKYIHRTFSSKKKMISEIFSQLETHSIGIEVEKKKISEIFSRLEPHTISIGVEVATFNDNKEIDFLAFDKLVQTSPTKLLEGPGLYFIAHYSPEILNGLFTLAEKTPSDHIRSAIAKGIIEKTKDSYALTGLQSVARYAPHSLPTLFKLADGSQGQAIHAAIAKALIEKRSGGLSGLHYMVYFAPKYLPELFKLQKTWLHDMARHSPDSIYDVIRAVLQSESDTKSRNVNLVLEALAIPNSDGITGWHMIHKHATSSDKIRILDSLLSEYEKLDTKDLVAVGVEISQALTKDKSHYRGICKERDTFFHTEEYGKTNLWQELMEKTQSILRERKDLNRKDIDANELLSVKIGRWF